MSKSLENLLGRIGTHNVIDMFRLKEHQVIGIPLLYVYKSSPIIRRLIQESLIPLPLFVVLHRTERWQKESCELWGSQPILTLGELWLYLDIAYSFNTAKNRKEVASECALYAFAEVLSKKLKLFRKAVETYADSLQRA